MDNEVKNGQDVTVAPKINLNLDPTTAINLQVMEFEKKIAEAEAVVYDLKKQKFAYIYDTNVNSLINQAQQQQQQPAPEVPVSGTQVPGQI